MRLPELQQAMRAGILGEAPDALLAAILPAGLDPAARLQIHRNNTIIGLTEALKTTFPVVARLVGERFFGFAAASFIRMAPPAQPCLAEYGTGFPRFLAGFEPAASLPYLPDVARLEWVVNEAYNAPDEAPLAPAAIADLSQELYPRLKLALQASCRFVASSYPIKRIWLANQTDAPDAGTIDLGAGGVQLLVMRRGFEVALIELDAAEQAFLTALDAGKAIETAHGAALALDPNFDLAAVLARQFARGSLGEAIPPTQ